MNTTPASVEQSEVWLACQREPESDRYNITVDVEFTPAVDVTALRAAFADVVRAHPTLRSRFDTIGGQLTRVIETDPPLALVEERSADPYDRARAQRWAVLVGRAPLDLTVAPVVRAALLVADGGALLAVTMHHIISDGWSVDVFTRELVAAYRARLAGEPLPAKEEVPAQEEVSTEAEPGSEDYWADLLSEAPTPLTPLHDLAPEDGLPGESASLELPLPADVVASVRAVAKVERSSPAVVLLSGWSILLHAWSGRAEGTFGTVFAGREPGSEDLIDLRSRVLPMRDRLDPDRPFRDVLAALRNQLLDSLEHSALPVERLQHVERTVFMHTPAPADAWPVGDCTIRRLEHLTDTTKYEFSLNIIEGADDMRLLFYYDAARYRASSVRLFAEQLRDLLAAATTEPATSCGDLLVACDSDRPSTSVTRTQSELIPDLVLQCAAERPNAVAVRHGDDTITYGELVDRACAIANWLRDNGVREGDIVALLLPPGIDPPVFWLGTVLAGAAYVPLDPAYPTAQLQLIVDDAKPPVLVVDPEWAGEVTLGSGTVISVSDLLAQAPTGGEPPVVDRDGESTFCVLYTSGTTGRPKGVVVPHRGMARLMAQPDFIPLDDSDVVAQLCPLNFDGAAYEVWGALAHGAQLVVFDKHLVLDPRAMRAIVRERGVTTLLVTTPLLNRIIEDAPDLLQSLRRVYFGGELISVSHMRRALNWCRPGVLLHSYGPTENSFTSTWFPITEVDLRARTLPIGDPVPGTELYVVQEGTTRLAPRGVAGELLLGGTGLAHGYLNDPELTAARFVPNPFSADERARLYRTGDRVRWTAHGLLEFIGRTDNQVKIRSQRVELGEVEAVVDAHPSVRSVFVTARRNQRDEKEIVAYVVGAADEAELRRHAQARLPGFAVPRHFVLLDQLPLTPTGKIDRRRLPDPEHVVVAAAPSTGAIEGVRAAWRAVLGQESFGHNQNFFDAGGHSLLLVRLQDELRAATGVTLSIMDLMRHATVREQSDLLAGQATSPDTAPVVTRARTTVVVPSAEQSADGHVPQVIALSASTGPLLDAARHRLAEHLRATPGLSLDDVARTLDVGREPLPHRFAVVAADLEEAVRGLEGEPGARVFLGAAEAPPPAAPADASPEAVARAWCRGAEVGLTPAGRGRRIRLPGQPLAWAVLKMRGQHVATAR
ncbi:amino acid adenylation domain-containing protein [Allokutzneria sp. A3M-2-11 16]|uniref:non-ribosomal peptide synthetase n=1 Tax=Allokutzneria sp. A3M-2-11 16 TaxID=2962043 RepID=UPI0020B8CBF9|nr:amino acid adenylation domain-containing protein [Allokutzneria sp. A3M-2-11 16]MCP3803140.1 amino acid adenylation domain-containing protein [Allokutzneria sp. A3M-2-11 16]